MILLLESAESVCDDATCGGRAGWLWSGILELQSDFWKPNCLSSLKVNISQVGRLDHVKISSNCSDL